MPPAGLRMGSASSFPEEKSGRRGHLAPECRVVPRQGGGKDVEIERRWPGHHGVSQGQSPGKDAFFGRRWAGWPWKDGEAARRAGVAPGSPRLRRPLRAAGKVLAAARDQPGSPRLPRKVRPAPLRRPRRMRDAGLTIDGFLSAPCHSRPPFPISRPTAPHRAGGHQSPPSCPPQPRLSRPAHRPAT